MGETKYDVCELFGMRGLFTQERIPERKKEDGLYSYELRENDYGYPCQVKPFVWINFGGTVFLRSPIPNFSGSKEIEITVVKDETVDGEHCESEDFYFTGEAMTIEEFIGEKDKSDGTTENKNENSTGAVLSNDD